MLLVYITFFLVTRQVLATEIPIIGILSLEVNKTTYPGYSSYIAASYVKAVEQTGARVVPIFINGTEQYYKNILNSINGVVIPGGATLFTNVGGYADAARIIRNHAEEMNKKNDHFPILGVCLGFELLVYLEVNTYDVLEICNCIDVSLPLKFTRSFRNSNLYRGASEHIIDILSNRPVTFNHHKRCVTEELLNQFSLTNKWHILSTNEEGECVKFISSAEHRDYPFVGVIFHPEKIAYEWNAASKIPHSSNAVLAARHFYDWLAKEARKSNHSFNSANEEESTVIYNYVPKYVHGYFEQVYLFK